MVSDEIKAYNKQYRIDNKEKILQQEKQYRIKNKAKRNQQKKQYYFDNLKICSIRKWKIKGLKDDFDMVWERYDNSTNCENCNVVYGKKGDGTGTWKCMDHDHSKLENNFRNILCNRCNTNLNSRNTSGYPNIYKFRMGWRYLRIIHGKRHEKNFKSYYEVVVYKYLYEYFNLLNI